jgi:glucosamine--fructose-6-phosphate aminotransferase (isomerizing)
MCGIIGVISNNTIEIIKKGLIQLQNRGYDSVGISVMEDKFKTIKYASNDNDCFENLFNNINKINNCKIGIGHTRWATHGKKSDNNSHPHLSFNKNIILAHNGIIENYKSIKEMLLAKNYIFNSETDSEVIVNLIDYYYNVEKKDFEEILKNLEDELEGTWALVIMNLDYKNKLFCCRHGSPLLIGISDDCAIISSEKAALNNYVNNYFILNSNDICIIEDKSNNIVINTRNKYIYKENKNQTNLLSPEPYKYWIEREINEQYESSLRAISLDGRLLNNSEVILGGLEINKKFLKRVENLVIIGCGTSFHSGMLSKYYFNDLCNFNSVSIIDGGEFDINDISKKGITAIILLSQSGETKDIYDCLKIAQENNIFTIGIVNTVDSMIARETNCGCYINAGREMSVASTKSFTNQVIVLSMVAIWFSQIHNINENKREKYIKYLRQLPYDIKDILENVKIDDKIIDLLDKKNIFILGKEKGEALSKEASLKIKEISYIHAEGYSSSGLKHGPFALLDKNMPVILLLLRNKFYSKNYSCYEEIISRESPVLIINNYDIETCDDYEYVISIPYNELYNELLAIIPLQIIAYKLSIKHNINPDKPRNLAKCVTTD